MDGTLWKQAYQDITTTVLELELEEHVFVDCLEVMSSQEKKVAQKAWKLKHGKKATIKGKLL